MTYAKKPGKHEHIEITSERVSRLWRNEETRVHSHRKTHRTCHDWQASPSRPPATVPRVRSSETCATLPVTGALTTMQVMEACNVQRRISLCIRCTVSCLDAGVMLGRSLGRESAWLYMRPHPFRALYDLVCELGVWDHICTRTTYCKWPRPGAAQMRCGVGQWRKVLPRLQVLAPMQRSVTPQAHLRTSLPARTRGCCILPAPLTGAGRA